jgi:hypothetical protein
VKEAPAEVAPVPTPAPVEDKKKRAIHANTKTFTKLTDEMKQKISTHSKVTDKEFTRRLRTHLMLGKSFEVAEKLATRE